MEIASTGNIIERERKYRGLSRRKLANRLGIRTREVVSWEKGETVPSLRMLSLLSEVLDVSPEELMHGRRDENRTAERMSQDEQKKARRMMVTALSRFRRLNFISISFATFGVFLGTFANIVMHRAWGGFILNLLAVIAGCISEASALKGAYSAIDTDSLGDKHIALYKASVLKLGMYAYSIGGLFIGWSLPLLIYVDSFDEGLNVTETFMYGAIWGSVAFVTALSVCFFLHAHFIRKGLIPLNEKDKKIYFHNHRLIAVLVTVFVVLLSLGIVGEWWFTRRDRLVKKIEFWSIDEFTSYMEKDLRYPYDGSREKDMAVFYVDRHGDPISVDEALKTVLRDRNGNLVCTYLDRNRNVHDIELPEQRGQVFPITVKTFTAIRDAKEKEILIHTIFAFVYAFEMSALFIIYLRKRQEHED